MAAVLSLLARIAVRTARSCKDVPLAARGEYGEGDACGIHRIQYSPHVDFIQLSGLPNCLSVAGSLEGMPRSLR